MKYDLSWRDHMAFRFATRKSRTDAIHTAVLIAFVLAAYAVAGTIEMHAEEMIALEASYRSESAYAQALRDCMSAGENKQAGGFYFPDTKLAYECKVQKL